MKRVLATGRTLVIAMLLGVTPAAAIAPAHMPLKALGLLQRGEWELRIRGEDGAPRRMCVRDLRQLLQVEHRDHLCPSFVVGDDVRASTITYDCAAAGNGRTVLRVETARLVQISSQGVSGGAPFAYDVEGRRVGACR